MPYFCNPLNVPYRYQFNQEQPQQGGGIKIAREAADPSLILFKGRYYLFASMTLGVWVSDDLVSWTVYPLPRDLPLYDYAPDVRAVGEYMYFSASKKGEVCDFYRTKDPIQGPYERIPGTFDFWDPNLFCDDDGRLYFYWGCDAITPLWGVELDPETMRPKGEKTALLTSDAGRRGYERTGEDNTVMPLSVEQAEAQFEAGLKAKGMDPAMIPDSLRMSAVGYYSHRPYIEGAWMTKHNGRYYLQYAFAGTQFNTYGDGVYESDSPLGPFSPAKNNPYSYQPGGFLPGAGHGSTLEDKAGNWWHTATSRVSMNHQFERRVGLWPAGFDQDGELFCNQRYGDWPQRIIPGEARDPWQEPEWMLLSYGKAASCSGHTEGHGPELAADENVQTWWQCDAQSGWLQLDLGKAFDVRAVQVNFADDKLDIPVPGPIQGNSMQLRYIDDSEMHTRWRLLGSADAEHWEKLADRSEADTDLTHELVVPEGGKRLRYIRLEALEVPYGQRPCISGLRVFGGGEGEKPSVPAFTAKRTNALDMEVEPHADGAAGYSIMWGHAPDKLYHSCTVFGGAPKRIGALVEGENYFVRVDAFNENGITHGEVKPLTE